jgi:ABC-type transport system involved in multi-copper enzyme maturation permease subunit
MTAVADRPARGIAAASTWRVSWTGLRTVATLELRQRVRSTRWIVVLALWFLALLGLTVLIRSTVYGTVAPPAVDGDQGPVSPELLRQSQQFAAAAVFGAIVFLVLGLGGLIAPALTATSVNGDRAAGVLATLQTTLLTPAEIALGKLAAAWLTALAFLAAAAPFVIWAYLDGGTPAGRLLTTLAVLALTLLVVCAVGLGWSAVAARTASSSVLTYLSVVFLGLGLPILFGLTVPLVQQKDTVQVRQMTGDDGCETVTAERVRIHSERTWWLLAANPFVVVADSAPPARFDAGVGVGDPLTSIRDAVRGLRLGPEPVVDECFGFATFGPDEQGRRQAADALPATWPYGLGLNLALGAGFAVVAVRRLRAPARVLPRGTRVA